MHMKNLGYSGLHVCKHKSKDWYGSNLLADLFQIRADKLGWI